MGQPKGPKTNLHEIGLTASELIHLTRTFAEKSLEKCGIKSVHYSENWMTVTATINIGKFSHSESESKKQYLMRYKISRRNVTCVMMK